MPRTPPAERERGVRSVSANRMDMPLRVTRMISSLPVVWATQRRASFSSMSKTIRPLLRRLTNSASGVRLTSPHSVAKSRKPSTSLYSFIGTVAVMRSPGWMLIRLMTAVPIAVRDVCGTS